jgi:hypothetical protein
MELELQLDRFESAEYQWRRQHQRFQRYEIHEPQPVGGLLLLNASNRMKKLIVILLLLCVALASSAQFRYGIKAGANYSDLSVSTGTSATLIKVVDAIPAWKAGFMAQYNLGDFAFQSELMYSVEGGDLLNANPGSGKLRELVGSGTTVSYRSQNLQVPLNIQYGREFGPVRLYAMAGPYISFLLNGTLNGEKRLWTVVQEKWGFNKVDLGFGAGIGAELKNLQLTLRYDFGGTEIGKKATTSQVTTNLNPFFDMKERNLSLTLGYFF